MKLIFLTAIVFVLAACATEPYPNKRPLTSEAMELIGATDVVVVENNTGIGVTWFAQDSSASSAQFGLIGGLTSAIMDAIANSAPSARASRVADDISEDLVSNSLNASFVSALEAAEGDGTISFSAVSLRQPITSKESLNDAIEILTRYSMAEDGSAIRVSATATYANTAMQYVTPYTFESSVPKPELSGPLYRNTIVYNSKTFPVPALTETMKQELVEALTESFRDANGDLPVEGEDGFKKMKRQIEDAQDDTLKKYEALVFVSQAWLKEDAAELTAEIEKAHAFIAKYILRDINSSNVPSLEGVDELVETLEDGRVVRLVGSGFSTGQIISSPGDTGVFPTYGNTTSISDREREKVKQLRAARKSGS